jgi:hypothetical protein
LTFEKTKMNNFDPSRVTVRSAHFIGGQYLEGAGVIDVARPCRSPMQRSSIMRWKTRGARSRLAIGRGVRRASGRA